MSCSNPTIEQGQTHRKAYFDLKGYFKQEAKALYQKKSLVDKTVYKNKNEKETKRLYMDSWEKEFDFFTSSDINKPDWTNSYVIDSTAFNLSYTTKDPKLRTKKIEIYRNKAGEIDHISIHNSDKNWLYQSDEELDYFPDSMYKIQKKQRIRFIGTNEYSVLGILVNAG